MQPVPGRWATRALRSQDGACAGSDPSASRLTEGRSGGGAGTHFGDEEAKPVSAPTSTRRLLVFISFLCISGHAILVPTVICTMDINPRARVSPFYR